MKNSNPLDCVVIGYNETPFNQYESLLRNYGEDSEAYRDLKFSFIDLDNHKLTYVDLLNYVYSLAKPGEQRVGSEFRSGDIPNLAAVYLTNFLKKRGLGARYINLFQNEKEKLAHYLAENPLCVAITTTFYVLNFPVNEIIQFVRQHNRQVKIIVGGPLIANHARNYDTDAFKTALKDIGADIYVVESQGELALSRIVTCLKSGGQLQDIPNIVYFETGKSFSTPAVSENNSLDENLIDWKDFAGEGLGATVQTRTARGCAFKCAFCNYPTRAGKLTLVQMDTLEKELNSIREVGGVSHIIFIDDTFNIPLHRFKELCKLMIRENYGFKWFSYFRCGNADEETIELMARSGCGGVFLGLESGSPAILKKMRKAAAVERYLAAIELLHRHRIMTFGSFVCGFPGETEETINETIDFIKEAKLDYYRAQIWYCEPGTPIYYERDKYNIEGQGFVWNHATMDSLEAMDHIDRLFLTVTESVWLPQWSFDFWIIPYLLGRGVTLAQMKEFMELAHKLLALEIASVSKSQKKAAQQEYLLSLIRAIQGWSL